MKKFILALLTVFYISCAAAMAENNILKEAELTDWYPTSFAGGSGAGDIGNKNGTKDDLKKLLTDGVKTNPNNVGKWFIQYPNKLETSPRLEFTFSEIKEMNCIEFTAGADFTVGKKLADGLHPDKIKIYYMGKEDTEYKEITGKTYNNIINLDKKYQQVIYRFEKISVKKLKIEISCGLGNASTFGATNNTYQFRIREIEAYMATDNEKNTAFKTTAITPASGDIENGYSQLKKVNTEDSIETVGARFFDGVVKEFSGANVWYVKYPEKLGSLPSVSLETKDGLPTALNNIAFYSGINQNQDAKVAKRDWLTMNNFSIEYTDDGTVWKTINLSNCKKEESFKITGIANTQMTGAQVIKLWFPQINAKQLRIVFGKGTGINSTDNNVGFRIREIEIYDDPAVQISNRFDAASAIPVQLHSAVFTSGGNSVYSPQSGSVLTKIYYDRLAKDGCKIIAAVYDENEKLVNTVFKDTDETGTANLDISADGGRVKLFAWENNSVKPYVAPYDTAPDKKTTVFTFGDSLMANSTGWPMVLAAYAKEGKAEINNEFSLSGASTTSAINDGSFDGLLTAVNEGDYVIMSFGHNDQYKNTAASGENGIFRYNLSQMIDNIRKHGAIPVLATPISRFRFDENGNALDTLCDYSSAMKAVASAKHVPLLDMGARTLAEIQESGAEGIVRTYYNTDDNVHLTEAGAAWVSDIAIDEMQRIGLPTALMFEKK